MKLKDGKGWNKNMNPPLFRDVNVKLKVAGSEKKPERGKMRRGKSRWKKGKDGAPP